MQPVHNAGGVSKGVVAGNLMGEETGEEMVGTVSEARSKCILLWGGDRGSDVGNDDFPQ